MSVELVLILTVLPAVAGCSILADDGTRIANDIRAQRSPLILDVRYSGDDDESGPSLTIVLIPGATQSDGQTIACDVVAPAIQRGKPPEGLVFAVTDSATLEWLATDKTSCS